MISDNLRQAVEQRAQSADSQQQIGGIIFSALRDSGVAWQQVDRDGIKQLVVDAVRAFRSAHHDVADDRVSLQRGGVA